MKRISLVICCLCLATISSPTLGAIIYGVGSSDSKGVYLIDTDASTTTFLFDPDIDWHGATDGDDATSFFATLDGGSLYRIDVVGQTATAIGAYSGPQINGLAFNESSGILFGTDNSSLYSIDTTTGSPTLIGSLNGPGTVWAIDYDASIDELVAVNNADQSMYYIDMTTGNGTLIGSTGQTRITDIWYDQLSSSMFGAGSYPNQLYEINSLTGAATVIGSIDEALMGLGNPIPEPCTFLLFGLGSLALRRRCRK